MSRLEQLPPYLFAAIDAAKVEARARGADLVDLGIGDPDRPTPAALVGVLQEAAARPEHHRYPAQRGSRRLRETIAAWLADRYGVTADPDREILVLIGSKEGLAHLPLSYVAEGDNTLVPDIGYPVYGQGTILAGATPRTYALEVAADYLPDPGRLAALADDRTRLVYLNYPHNPTGAVANPTFWRGLVDAFGGHPAVLVNDAAYVEVTFDGRRPSSLLQAVDHRRRSVIELHSLSKLFNMTGWRVGFAVGSAEVVGALGRVKDTMDSGVFTPIQEVAVHALGPDFADLRRDVMAPYPRRREIMVAALTSAGYEVYGSGATFYVWVRVPGDESSLDFCSRALAERGLVLTPGNGFGPGGEGWFRISLTAPDEVVAEGARRFAGWR